MCKKKDKIILIICLLIFLTISIISIYSVNKAYVSKQIMWYMIGFVIILILKKFNIKNIIYNYHFVFYIITTFLLFLLLIFGREINGSKCWFIIPKLGSFQPSEFMKLALILTISKILSKNKKENDFKNDLKLFFKIIFLLLLPIIFTFLEPDTGMVIIYIIITFIMLFSYGLDKKIFILLFILGGLLIGGFLYFYFNYQDEFIKIFGTSFFYRIDRLLDWSNKSGMQLTNAITSIKSAGLTGFGIDNMQVYIPEAHTDFIFSIYSSVTGFIGTIILIITIIVFDITLSKCAIKSTDKLFKFITIGFVGMILYQQVQNISMNIGLLPITGITLPFISYGGSSLLSYMIMISIILNYKTN